MVDDASMGQCMLCVNKGNNDAPGFQKIVFRVSYKLQLYCVWIGFVLCRFDFFHFSLLPIMVKIPLMSHSSVPFSHTRTNCDRVRNIKFLTSHLHLLVDTARSTDRACGRKLLEWHLPRVWVCKQPQTRNSCVSGH